MPKVSKEIASKRPEEIMNACVKLYSSMNFREITLNDISRETSFSRPSIYNYFSTKEEIFLMILQNEYEKWIEDLEWIREKETLSPSEFASLVASSLEKRVLLLKILCMNLFEIEEESRDERLLEFKNVYKESVEVLAKAISKFFPMLDGRKYDFLFSFFPFMYGLYPYVYPTRKQMDAMEKAEVKRPDEGIYELTRRFIENLLEGMLAKEEDTL